MVSNTLWTCEIQLNAKEYSDDFWTYFKDLKHNFRKIEFGQIFAEPGNPSWEAFNRGEWQQSLDLMRGGTDFSSLTNENKKARRIRIIEKPFSDYLIWELHVLRCNQTLGEDIRVIDMQNARHLMMPVYLDDFIAIDETVAYRVLYDVNGVNSGAERTTDAKSILELINAFDLLFNNGEPLNVFFTREASMLKPMTGKK